MSGKGSRPRNLGPKFRTNYDAIFRKPKLIETIKHSPTCWQRRLSDGTSIWLNPQSIVIVRCEP